MTTEQQRISAQVEGAFLAAVREVYGDNLVSVLVYGSVVKGTFRDRVSDANVLIVLRQADPWAAAQLGRRAGTTMRRNRITPLLLTEEEFSGAADVFPMEYLDILDARKVIFGDDPAASLVVTRSNLRHEVETALRGSIASLRRALVASAGRESRLRRYMVEWFGSQTALVRGLLRLGGRSDIPTEYGAAVEAIGDLYGVDAAPLAAIAHRRAGRNGECMREVDRLLACLTGIARKVDTMVFPDA